MYLSSAHAALVYVDATGGVGGNTVNALTESETDWYEVNTGSPTNNLWDQRTGNSFVYGGTAFQINSAETSIVIRTAVTGLLPNSTYTDIRLYYLGNILTTSTRNWTLQASVVSESTGFTNYEDGSGTALIDSNTDALGTADDGSTLSADTRYWVSLPDVTTDETGTFYVWINIGDGANDRAVYDGLAYNNVAIPEPSAVALLSLVGLGFGMRRRRR
ncbi:PEP-CTERM sorting domain-containing protein [Luteolibacter pohnpeiensis]|uniref:PEP-CTERM sorting domain-containing protein n=1 Tax=Luteolibacter pohnpeiensis TaxID=454153 RepID=A0A934S8I4_9BACT|nr:PEP-CTERM sorting domain-containing protein [Luteolibacter pohnpeiensis]